MRIRMRIMMPLLAFALVPLGSCSVINKNKGGGSSANVNKEAVLPTDREKIVKPVSGVYTSEELAKGIVKGDWAVERVNGLSLIHI